MVISCSKGNDGKDKAERQRAGVAHKDFGWREVEDEETEKCSDEEQGKCADEHLTAESGGGEKNCGDY